MAGKRMTSLMLFLGCSVDSGIPHNFASFASLLSGYHRRHPQALTANWQVIPNQLNLVAVLVRQEHGEAINTATPASRSSRLTNIWRKRLHPAASCRRQAVLQGSDEVVVNSLRFVVPLLGCLCLAHEALQLPLRVIPRHQGHPHFDV